MRVGKLSYALAYIDAQAPILTYFGFAMWIAWNTLAFSGTAWFYDPTNSFVIEELVSQHLIACAITSLAFALTARYCMHVMAKNWFTIAGALVACFGTFLIVATRGESDASKILFTIGCACSGAGTTALFLRGVPLIGALSPRKALITLIACTLVSYGVFFMVNSCPQPLNSALFIAVPLVSAGFYCLRSVDVNGEEQVLHRDFPFTRMFPVLMVCIAFCSFGFDIVRAYLLVDVAPQDSNNAQVIASVMTIGVFMVLGLITLLTKPDAYAGVKTLYPATMSVLVVLLVLFVLVMPQGIIVASCTKTVQTVFNTTVWAMFAYIVFQSKSNALRVFGFGNMALCIGTLLASRLGMVYFDAGIDDNIIRLILCVLCVIILLVALFVFPEKQLDKILLPIETERLLHDAPDSVLTEQAQTEEATDKRRGEWKQRIQLIAQKYKLTPRETVVFTWLAKGRTQQQIADIECVSIHTVRSQARSIHIKMEVHTKTELDHLIQQELQELKPAG